MNNSCNVTALVLHKFHELTKKEKRRDVALISTIKAARKCNDKIIGK